MTIIPIEFRMTTYIAFRDGLKFKHGSVPEFSYRNIDQPLKSIEGKFEMKDCIHLENLDF